MMSDECHGALDLSAESLDFTHGFSWTLHSHHPALPRFYIPLILSDIYPAAVKREQCPKRNEIVAMDEQVFALPVFGRGAVSFDAFQEVSNS